MPVSTSRSVSHRSQFEMHCKVHDLPSEVVCMYGLKLPVVLADARPVGFPRGVTRHKIQRLGTHVACRASLPCLIQAWMKTGFLAP